MKFTFVGIAISTIFGWAMSSNAQVRLELEWMKNIGSVSYHETVFSTAIDTKGNVIALTRTWDSGSELSKDIFKVQKYTTAGELLWQKELHGAMEQGMLPAGLCIDSNDNVFFLLNTFNKSFYFGTILFECPNWESTIFKLSNSGDLLWTKQIDRLINGWAQEDNTALLAIDRNNDLVLTGRAISSDSTFKIDKVPYFAIPVYGSFFVAKFSNDGIVLWVKLFDQRPEEHRSAGDYVAIDGSNNIYVLGKFWSAFKYFETELLSEGIMDMFLAKILPTGKLVWINRIGSSLSNKADFPWGLAIDEEDNAYIQGYVYEDVTISGWTGVSTGSSDAEIFICKFDPIGKVVWNKRIDGLDYQRLGHVIDDCPMGLVYSQKDNSIICRSHIFTTATIDSTKITINAGDGEPVLWAYTTDGELLWSKAIKIKDGYVQFNDIDVDKDGNIFMGGYAGRYWEFNHEPNYITIEDTSFSTIGGADGILAKFSIKEFSDVATEGQSVMHLQVYPNPFSERTTIVLPDIALRATPTIQIFNVLGIKVIEAPLTSNDGRFILERHGIPAGIYHFQVIANKEPLARGEFVIR